MGSFYLINPNLLPLRMFWCHSIMSAWHLVIRHKIILWRWRQVLKNDDDVQFGARFAAAGPAGGETGRSGKEWGGRRRSGNLRRSTSPITNFGFNLRAMRFTLEATEGEMANFLKVQPCLKWPQSSNSSFLSS